MAIEIANSRENEQDYHEKLILYERLQIPEYFIFDLQLSQIVGYTLKNGHYQSIPEVNGKVKSTQLWVELGFVDDFVRLYYLKKLIPLVADLTNEIMQLTNEKLKLVDDKLKLVDKNIKLTDDKLKLANENMKLADDKLKLTDENIKLIG